MTRTPGITLAVALTAFLLALGCSDSGGGGSGGDTADGFQSVGTGDTFCFSELFAEFEDGKWTGCLRFDHSGGDGTVSEECGDPAEDLVSFGIEPIFGAVRDGARIEFVNFDSPVELFGPDSTGHQFFVVAIEVQLVE
jgi:hypothetical protein